MFSLHKGFLSDLRARRTSPWALGSWPQGGQHGPLAIYGSIPIGWGGWRPVWSNTLRRWHRVGAASESNGSVWHSEMYGKTTSIAGSHHDWRGIINEKILHLAVTRGTLAVDKDQYTAEVIWDLRPININISTIDMSALFCPFVPPSTPRDLTNLTWRRSASGIALYVLYVMFLTKTSKHRYG